MVQQDSNLSSYLKARGLDGDSRVNSSYEWAARELIAEDYRQLFGSANAAALAQANQVLPPASHVSGLKDFLASAFMQPPAAPAPPAPAPTLSVSIPTVAPLPFVASGTVTFSLSVQASVTAKILNSKGSLVRTLLSNVSEAPGLVTATWNRRNTSGRKVKRGTYVAYVQAVDGSGKSVVASTKFFVK